MEPQAGSRGNPAVLTGDRSHLAEYTSPTGVSATGSNGSGGDASSEEPALAVREILTPQDSDATMSRSRAEVAELVDAHV
jgi:hypothetical protein